MKRLKLLEHETLANVDMELVKALFKLKRKKVILTVKVPLTEREIANMQRFGKKRNFSKSGLPPAEELKTNSNSKVIRTSIGPSNLSLAKFMIDGFNTFNNDIQNKLLETIDQKLRGDQSLMHLALDHQVKSLVQVANTLYETKQQVKLIELFENLAPMAAILLNIELSLTNEILLEEGGTLATTLLPYLNLVTDYNFMEAKADFIASRFLNALSKHVHDNKVEIGAGFMAFGLKYDPTKLKNLVEFANNRCHLTEALVVLGYSNQSANIISTNPSKLLWPELLKFFVGKT